MSIKLATTFKGNIDEALKKWPDHLYVRNAIKRDNTQVLVDVKDSSGKNVCLAFPKTWVPIDIFDYVDKEAIIKSSQLRAYVRNGILKLVDADSAKEVLETKEAAEEAKRCGLSYNSALLEESKPSDVKSMVQPQKKEISGTTNFYQMNYDKLEDCNVKKEAEEIVEGVVANFISNYDEDAEYDKTTAEYLIKMKEVTEGSNWKDLTTKLDDIISMATRNAPQE